MTTRRRPAAGLEESDFRRLALGLTDVVEAAHMGHPDFRAGGRIFATLKGDGEHGMVKLSPEQQARILATHPAAFSPESGAWGRQGCTRVRLEAVDEETLGEMLTLAWRNIVEKPKVKAVGPAARFVVPRAPRRPRDHD